MKPAPVLLLLMTLVSLLAGCGGKASSGGAEGLGARPDLAPDKGAITGLVVDDRYRPVAGAFLLLTPIGLTATSDDLGQFEFLDLQPGAYILQANAKDHEASPKNVDVAGGVYTEVEAPMRRLFGETGFTVTTQYSVFIGCAFSVVEETDIGVPRTGEDCMLDQSGDSTRFGFDSDYLTYRGNVTYLITEMKANHKASTSNGAYKVVVRDAKDADPYFASKFTVDSDYLKLTMHYGNKSADDTENRNGVWKNKEKLQTALFPQGGFKQETQTVINAQCGVGLCFESRGLGAQFGVKATFVQTLFIGEPTIDIKHYCVLAEKCE